MLDRAKFEGSYNESGEFDWQAFTALELRLISLYRRMSDEDRQRVRRMTEVLSKIPDGPDIDKVHT
ncbi:hypothetical protein [Pseudomonas syringae]|uniref:Uncharacterized protein n=1 Tax=Pseudomonas syringae TaxID=317 RepID=A0A085V4B3_PSESX|nr:hypothetical protein [Pseudomonas syringae]KFE50276.1 hypothetical protein IV02_17770 [Pseudomonas syringae]